MSYTTRLLPEAEWDRLQTEGPWAEAKQVPPPFGALDVVVVEDAEGRIVGTQGIVLLCHLEGLWTDPNRPTVGVIRRLWPAVQKALREAGMPVAFTIATDAEHEALYAHAGFQRVPGVLMGIDQGDTSCQP